MKLSLRKCWSLLIFDIIGLALSGYAFLLAYQVLMTLPNASIFIILMGIFVAIKVVIMALYDLNRNLLLKNIPFIAALISVIGNGIVFGICWYLLPEVPLSFFIGLTIFDFIIVLICHSLWWVLIGKDDEKDEKDEKDDDERAEKNEEVAKIVETKESSGDRKTWLTHSDEESEYDSIFTTLLENEKKGSQNSPESAKPGIIENEKRYQTSEFLKDIKLSLAKNMEEPKQSAETTAVPVTPINSSEPKPVELPNLEKTTVPKATVHEEVPIIEETVVLPLITTPVLEELGQEVQPQKKTVNMKELFKNPPSVEKGDESIENDNLQSKPPTTDETSKKKTALSEDVHLENEDDFLDIELRLGTLFCEIEKSMEETHFLQGAVSDFHDAIETYTPITGDEKIIATGNLIREKLKAIIDKQFVVDEVLDDLIRLSKLINNRIDDLDVIEAGLNQRKMNLDKKEVSIADQQSSTVADTDIKIMPEEVILENLESEFIIAEGDYETIRKYLTENPEK